MTASPSTSAITSRPVAGSGIQAIHAYAALFCRAADSAQTPPRADPIALHKRPMEIEGELGNLARYAAKTGDVDGAATTRP